MDDIAKILNDAGYKTVEGADATIEAIIDLAPDCSTLLCSGFGVHPDGRKCGGCKDCRPDTSDGSSE